MSEGMSQIIELRDPKEQAGLSALEKYTMELSQRGAALGGQYYSKKGVNALGITDSFLKQEQETVDKLAALFPEGSVSRNRFIAEANRDTLQRADALRKYEQAELGRAEIEALNVQQAQLGERILQTEREQNAGAQNLYQARCNQLTQDANAEMLGVLSGVNNIKRTDGTTLEFKTFDDILKFIGDGSDDDEHKQVRDLYRNNAEKLADIKRRRDGAIDAERMEYATTVQNARLRRLTDRYCENFSYLKKYYMENGHDEEVASYMAHGQAGEVMKGVVEGLMTGGELESVDWLLSRLEDVNAITAYKQKLVKGEDGKERYEVEVDDKGNPIVLEGAINRAGRLGLNVLDVGKLREALTQEVKKQSTLLKQAQEAQAAELTNKRITIAASAEVELCNVRPNLNTLYGYIAQLQELAMLGEKQAPEAIKSIRKEIERLNLVQNSALKQVKMITSADQINNMLYSLDETQQGIVANETFGLMVKGEDGVERAVTLSGGLVNPDGSITYINGREELIDAKRRAVVMLDAALNDQTILNMPGANEKFWKRRRDELVAQIDEDNMREAFEAFRNIGFSVDVMRSLDEAGKKENNRPSTTEFVVSRTSAENGKRWDSPKAKTFMPLEGAIKLNSDGEYSVAHEGVFFLWTKPVLGDDGKPTGGVEKYRIDAATMSGLFNVYAKWAKQAKDPNPETLATILLGNTEVLPDGTLRMIDQNGGVLGRSSTDAMANPDKGSDIYLPYDIVYKLEYGLRSANRNQTARMPLINSFTQNPMGLYY